MSNLNGIELFSEKKDFNTSHMKEGRVQITYPCNSMCLAALLLKPNVISTLCRLNADVGDSIERIPTLRKSVRPGNYLKMFTKNFVAKYTALVEQTINELRHCVPNMSFPPRGEDEDEDEDEEDEDTESVGEDDEDEDEDEDIDEDEDEDEDEEENNPEIDNARRAYADFIDYIRTGIPEAIAAAGLPALDTDEDIDRLAKERAILDIDGPDSSPPPSGPSPPGQNNAAAKAANIARRKQEEADIQANLNAAANIARRQKEEAGILAGLMAAIDNANAATEALISATGIPVQEQKASPPTPLATTLSSPPPSEEEPPSPPPTLAEQLKGVKTADELLTNEYYLSLPEAERNIQFDAWYELIGKAANAKALAAAREAELAAAKKPPATLAEELKGVRRYADLETNPYYQKLTENEQDTQAKLWYSEFGKAETEAIAAAARERKELEAAAAATAPPREPAKTPEERKAEEDNIRAKRAERLAAEEVAAAQRRAAFAERQKAEAETRRVAREKEEEGGTLKANLSEQFYGSKSGLLKKQRDARNLISQLNGETRFLAEALSKSKSEAKRGAVNYFDMLVEDIKKGILSENKASVTILYDISKNILPHIDKTLINKENADGDTPLSLALKNNNIGIIPDLLLANGANIYVDSKTKPFIEAIKNHIWSTVFKMIDKVIADRNGPDWRNNAVNDRVGKLGSIDEAIKAAKGYPDIINVLEQLKIIISPGKDSLPFKTTAPALKVAFTSIKDKYTTLQRLVLANPEAKNIISNHILTIIDNIRASTTAVPDYIINDILYARFLEPILRYGLVPKLYEVYELASNNMKDTPEKHAATAERLKREIVAIRNSKSGGLRRTRRKRRQSRR